MSNSQLEESAAESIASHLENSPADALVVVKGGAIVFEHYETMRPATASN